jgi:putative N6-adenine-specific DNA methylase
MKVIVRTLFGLEQVLADELIALGSTDIEILNRAVACEATERQIMQCNYLLRTALKVMVPILEVSIHDEEELYDAVKSIDWENIFNVNQTFATHGVTYSDTFRHSQFISLKAKDAIADRFRDIYGKRPFVNPVTPDISINIHIRQNILTVLLDSSGTSLHQRGYREYPVEAPLNEVLAAGMILISGWDQKSAFIDPMCGSGTLVIEAAMMACNIPPQRSNKKYCFMNWNEYDASLWESVLDEAKSKIDKTNCPPILAFDKSLQSVSAANTNIAEAKLLKEITLERKDFFIGSGAKNSTIITNPPYDQRLKEDDILAFYKNIGDKLKKDYTDCTAWIIGGNIDALKQIGLKTSKKVALMNGDLDAGFYKFDLYEGSKS